MKIACLWRPGPEKATADQIVSAQGSVVAALTSQSASSLAAAGAVVADQIAMRQRIGGVAVIAEDGPGLARMAIAART